MKGKKNLVKLFGRFRVGLDCQEFFLYSHLSNKRAAPHTRLFYPSRLLDIEF